MADTKWVTAFPVDELEVGQAKVFRREAQQVAVFRPTREHLFAVDNRCPHEGYPLAKGYVKDCVVTCRWHNFKFDLRDGRCVMGDEAVRTYPLRIVDGVIELDVSEPDPVIERAKRFASLEEAMLQRRLGQAARDIVRLLAIDVPPDEIAAFIASFDARYAEFGTTHVMPLCVDVLSMTDRRSGVQAVLPLMQAVDMASDTHRRRPLRRPEEPSEVPEDPRAAEARLRALVAGEDAAGAEALLRGALARGWNRSVVEPWLFGLCADHFLDFGHALIYQVKIFDLLDRVGWDHADVLLRAHLLSIVNGTREDTLPEWTWLTRELEVLRPRFAMFSSGSDHTVDREPIVDALLEAERDDMLAQVIAALEAGAALEVIVDALCIAAAHRVLRFDTGNDADPTVQEGWLDVTHLLTYANALRYAVRRYRRPDVVRLVLFGCRFVHHARALDAPVHRRIALKPAAGDASVDAIAEAVSSREPAAAVAHAARWLVQHPASRDVEPLRGLFEEVALGDRLVRPIVATHLIKTGVAAFDEHRTTGRPEPLLALFRLAASEVRERPVRRLCHEAIRFVIEGKVPRTLT